MRRSARVVWCLGLVVALLLSGCAPSLGGRQSTTTHTPAGAHHLVIDISAGGSGTPHYSIVALSTRDGSSLWRHPLETPDALQTAASFGFTPFERDGIVYVGSYYDSRTVIHRGVLEALDAASGRLLWRHETDGILVGTAAVDGSVVYLSSQAQHAIEPPIVPKAGFVEALNNRDGSVRWRAKTDGFPGVPSVGDGLVYTLAHQIPGGTDTGGHLLALNASDGSPAWKYDSDVPLSMDDSIVNAPLVMNGKAYIYAVEREPDGVANVALLAIDTRDGTVAWRFKTGGIAGTPAFASNIACVVTVPSSSAGVGGIVGLDVSDGAPRWSTKMSASAVGTTMASRARACCRFSNCPPNWTM